ncbi:hypothetical protein BN1723_018640, partial [Verticillium longisporum]
MSPKTKDSRKLIYRLANMAGTSDWAIDLGVDVGRANAEKALDDWPELDLSSNCPLDSSYDTLDALDAAGVPTNKLMVGVSSYGRSFKMAQMGCEGPNCFFLGGRNQSPAKAGTCTGTPGYIADAEMMQIALNA